MLTKKKVLSLCLALVKAGDSKLLHGEEILAGEGLGEEDKARVRDVGEVVQMLCNDYSYLRSAAFENETRGKSEAYISMKSKMEASPAKKKERLEALYAAIRSVMDDSQTLTELISPDQRSAAEKLLTALKALPIPNM